MQHWGIYEAPKLDKSSIPTSFVSSWSRPLAAGPRASSPAIHGVRYGVPLYVGEPQRSSPVSARRTWRGFAEGGSMRSGGPITASCWRGTSRRTRKAAEILAARENKRIDFVRLNSGAAGIRRVPRACQRSKHKDYGPLLSFIQPPEVRVAVRRVGKLKYQFDVSESVSLNKDGVIAERAMGFRLSKHGRFTSTQGYAFRRDKKTERPELVVES